MRLMNLLQKCVNHPGHKSFLDAGVVFFFLHLLTLECKDLENDTDETLNSLFSAFKYNLFSSTLCSTLLTCYWCSAGLSSKWMKTKRIR